MAGKSASAKPSGVGVDASGGPVVDPTANVIAVVAAETKRQDDLRLASDKYNDAVARHIEAMGELRALYQVRLADAEAKRIDAIRAVDVNAIAVASQRASDQATVLATQVVQSAEALRVLVASTAATVAQAQQQLGNTLSTRITTLEQAQYEGKGKQSYVDPLMIGMVTELKSLRESRNNNVGKSEGIHASWLIVVAVIGILLSGVAVYEATKAPQIIYDPTPTPAH